MTVRRTPTSDAARRATPLTRIRLRAPPVAVRTSATSTASRASSVGVRARRRGPRPGPAPGPSARARRRPSCGGTGPRPARTIASSRLVLPAALGPQTSCGPGLEDGVELRVAAQVADREPEQDRRGASAARRPRRGGAGASVGGRPGRPSGGRPDGHHDVDVAVVAHRPEDARRQRAVELEREPVRLHVAQHVVEVAGVERDRRRRRPRSWPRRRPCSRRPRPSR